MILLHGNGNYLQLQVGRIHHLLRYPSITHLVHVVLSGNKLVETPLLEIGYHLEISDGMDGTIEIEAMESDVVLASWAHNLS